MDPPDLRLTVTTEAQQSVKDVCRRIQDHGVDEVGDYIEQHRSSDPVHHWQQTVFGGV